MGKTFSDNSGDGVIANRVQVYVQLPDAGSTVALSGSVQPAGGALVSITTASVTAPTPPGSGSIYWIIQVDTSGTATVKQSTSAMPTPDAGNVQIYSDTMSPTDSDLATDPNVATPDDW